MNTFNTHPDKQTNIMEVSNLRLKFPGAASLLFKDLSFSVSEGEKVLFLGPSGCGKSTLLQVLSGLIPHSIEVPLKHDTIKLPNSYGFVFQDPDTQFCMPYVDEELAFVLENLQVPRNEMDPLIKETLKKVGLQSVEPHTQIQTLSQGMKQRLALASVLLLDPEVIFLDEPSALLDPEGTVQIWDSVKDVADEKTVIIVEHKIDHIADWVDRVVLFNYNGDIIADGAPETVFKTYKREINEYGIWYPNVWKDYVQSAEFKSFKTERELERQQKTTKQPVLTLNNFKGYYGKLEKIHVSKASIAPKSWVTIVGDNGAGKSTLLLALMRLIRGTGHYEILGDKMALDQKKLAPPKQLSLVFQNPELQFVTHTVFDEIDFSLRSHKLSKKERKNKIAHLLNMFHLHVDDSHHPFQLSIGQKRRLSVATAFAHHDDVLILDEPTFGQDARNTFIMLEKLEELRQKGTTIIMVTHDMNIVKYFSTDIWTIHNGQLIRIEENNSHVKYDRKEQPDEPAKFIQTSQKNLALSSKPSP